MFFLEEKKTDLMNHKLATAYINSAVLVNDMAYSWHSVNTQLCRHEP